MAERGGARLASAQQILICFDLLERKNFDRAWLQTSYM
jgi:hypothetical protein